MNLTKKRAKVLLADAIKNEKFAGFQNIGDLPKACDWAIKNGFDIEGRQELRNLLTEFDGDPIVIPLIKLKDGRDIAVFLRGWLRQSKYGPLQFLETRFSTWCYIESRTRESRYADR